MREKYNLVDDDFLFDYRTFRKGNNNDFSSLLCIFFCVVNKNFHLFDVVCYFLHLWQITTKYILQRGWPLPNVFNQAQ